MENRIAFKQVWLMDAKPSHAFIVIARCRCTQNGLLLNEN